MATPSTQPQFIEVISDHTLGQVFRATDPHGMYVVKEFKIAPALAEEHVREIREEFCKDASLLAALPRSPRLAEIKSHYVEGDAPMVVFHEPNGPKLADYLRKNRPSEEDAILGLAADVVGVYAALNKAGAPRINLDPSAWRLGEDGRAMYLDLHFAGFEICQRALPDKLWPGDARFLAPEQLEGMGATPASQVFSLGVLLYYLLTGRTPFEGPSAQAVRNLIQQTEAGTIRDERVSLPPELAEAIDLALCRYPEGRPQSLEEFAQAAALPDSDGLDIAAIAPVQAKAPEREKKPKDSAKDAVEPGAPPSWLPKAGIACAVVAVLVLAYVMFF